MGAMWAPCAGERSSGEFWIAGGGAAGPPHRPGLDGFREFSVHLSLAELGTVTLG